MRASLNTQLRYLAKKIHRPLPMTPLESEKLLIALKTSFREQLRKEVPGKDDHGRHSGGYPTAPSFAGIGSAAVLSSYAAASGHFHTMMNHPSFNGARGMVNRPMAREDNTEIIRDPLKRFKEEIAAGTITLKNANLYANVYLEQIIRDSLGANTRKQEGGLDFLSWILCNNVEATVGIKEKGTWSRFLRRIAEVLCLEGNQEKLWRWSLRPVKVQSGNIDPPKSEEGRSALGRACYTNSILIRALFRYEFTKHGEERALISLRRAFSEIKKMFPDHWSPVRRQTWLGNVAMKVWTDAAKLAIDGKISSPSFFNFLVYTHQDLDLPTSSYTAAMIALLHLQHPIAPDVKPAMDILDQLSKASPEWVIESLRPSYSKTRNLECALGIAATEFLMAKERYSGVSWLLHFIPSRYPDLVDVGGWQEAQPDESAAEASNEDEEQNLRLLDGLDISPKIIT
jgi:hypothetical protein